MVRAQCKSICGALQMCLCWMWDSSSVWSHRGLFWERTYQVAWHVAPYGVCVCWLDGRTWCYGWGKGEAGGKEEKKSSGLTAFSQYNWRKLCKSELMERSKGNTTAGVQKHTRVLFIYGTTGYKDPSHNLFLGCLVCLWLLNCACFHTRCHSLFTSTPPFLLMCCCLYLSISPTGNMDTRCTRYSLWIGMWPTVKSFIYFIGGINTVSHDACRNNTKLLQTSKCKTTAFAILDKNLKSSYLCKCFQRASFTFTQTYTVYCSGFTQT